MNQKVIRYCLLSFYAFCVVNCDVLAAQNVKVPRGSPVLHMIAVHEGEPNKEKFDKYCRKATSETIGTPVTEAPRPTSIEMTRISGECVGVNRYREVKVNVSDKSTPLVLVLNAYNFVTWIIKADRGVVIKKVILVGYHTQKITGLPIDVPVETYTYEPSPCPKCWQGNWREDMDYYGAKESPKELKGISDLPISTFQWRYTGGEFSIYTGMKRN